MSCWRCGTCHSLWVGLTPSMCRAAGHEAPYDDEAYDDQDGSNV